MKNKLSVVILAAGQGTRMKSKTPKVLHGIVGKPMIKWVLSAVEPLKPQKVYVVVGHGSEQIKNSLEGEAVTFVEQKEQLGSGHALLCARTFLKNFCGDVLVISGDVPLIQAGTLKGLISAHRHWNNSATILSSIVEDPFSYGRMFRLPSGQVSRIVEEKDATDEIKKIKEINSGIYVFSSPLVWKALSKITPENNKKEYYLTDTVEILNQFEQKVGACSDADSSETLGVNNRKDLACAEKILRRRILDGLMMAGVTILDPDTTYVSARTKISPDTVLHPGTIIEGKTVIGSDCSIGPFTVIKDSIIRDNVKVGPFSHLRPGTVLKSGAHIGNFSETKNATIGEGSKVNHLSYIGDSLIGKKVNIGAGTITCNYDGVNKHKTIIGSNSFIGSNVNLVAPVEIGENSLLGAGSTITDDVPENTLSIARARQINKPRKK